VCETDRASATIAHARRGWAIRARLPVSGGALPPGPRRDSLRYQLGSSELSSPARARSADMSIDAGWGVNESISTLAAGTLTV
jgi:hypothetical protein